MGTRRLVVFVSNHCPSCPDALEIARKVRQRHPDVKVETFNVDDEPPHPDVFAVPTYMLDDHVVCLGNPTDEQLDELLFSCETEIDE